MQNASIAMIIILSPV